MAPERAEYSLGSIASQYEPIQQNASPVTWLPPEILSRIFLYHTRPSPPEYEDMHSPNREHDLEWFYDHGEPIRAHSLYLRDQKTWLYILQVCRQWREVALSCALFWTNIDTSKTDLRTYMLQHSGSALVTLRLSFWGDEREQTKKRVTQTKKALFEHLHHVRRLGLVFYGSSADEIVGTVVPRVFSPEEAPELKALEIENGDRISVETLPPYLESLKLTHAWLSFSPNLVLDGITEFSLRPYDVFTTSENVDSFLHTLGRMTNLQQFYMWDSSATFDWVQPSRTTPISLPRLQTFRFEGLAQMYPYLLRYIAFPATTNHHLTVTESLDISLQDVEKVFYETVATTLKARVAADTQDHTYHVKFSITSKPSDGSSDAPDYEAMSIRVMVLTVPRASATEEAANRDPDPILTVGHESGSWRPRWLSVYLTTYLSNITDALPVDAVEELHLRSNMPLRDTSNVDESGTESEEETDEDGSAVLPSHKSQSTVLACSRVHTLHLEGSSPIEYMIACGALTAVTDSTGKLVEGSDPTNDPKGFAVFPKLERLVLKNIGWSLEDTMGLIPNSERLSPVLKSFSSILEARSTMFEGRYRLKEMELIGGAPEEWIERIEKKEWISGGVIRSGNGSYGDCDGGEYGSDLDGSEVKDK